MLTNTEIADRLDGAAALIEFVGALAPAAVAPTAKEAP